MTETDKKCDICHQSSVTWPGALTVLGPLDLCRNCFWQYREQLVELATFFNRHGRLPMRAPKETSDVTLSH
jgi:hypothetical protein